MRSLRRTTAALAVLTCLFAGVRDAHAGTYTIRNCDVPGHPNAPSGPWTAVPVGNMMAVDNCASGEGIAFVFRGDHRILAKVGSAMKVVRPASGASRAITLAEARLWFTAQLTGAGRPAGILTTTVRATSSSSSVLGLRGDTMFSPYHTDIDAGATSFQFGLVCDPETDFAADAADCQLSSDAPLVFLGSELTLREDVAPTIGALDGPMLDGENQSGVSRVHYVVGDADSGLLKIEALLDGKVAALRDLSPSCGDSDFTVCPPLDEGQLSVDTREVPNGSYPLVLRATDAAGNVRTSLASALVTVGNPPAVATLQDNPPVVNTAADVQIAAGFAGTPARDMVVSYGGRVTIRGRLTAGADQPIGGARIDVLQRTDRQRAREVVAGAARTAKNGTFTYRLVVRGPSRALRVRYSSSAGAPALESVALRVRVRSAASLRVVLRGASLRFRGRVGTGAIPAAGKRVTLLGRAPGFAWAAFASVRTDRLGRFAGSYRLPVRRPGVMLKIRVHVPAEAGYPYASYTGRPVTLRVR